MQARLCPEDEAQVKRCLDMGIGDVNKVLTLDDMVKGDDCMFTATAITECQLLNGPVSYTHLTLPTNSRV